MSCLLPTAAQIAADLATINAAIQALLSGKRLVELRVGSAEFARLYRYGEVSLDDLYKERARLEDLLKALCPDPPIFRHYASIPLVVTQRPVRG